MLFGYKELKDVLSEIQKEFDSKESKIEYLLKENKKLKHESYKDKELQAMKEEMKLMKEEYYRGFPISEEQEKAISEWKRKHNEEAHGKRMRSYSYHFYPTSLGTCGEVHCSCGAKFTFQEIT